MQVLHPAGKGHLHLHKACKQRESWRGLKCPGRWMCWLQRKYNDPATINTSWQLGMFKVRGPNISSIALPLFLQNQGLWLAVLSVNSSLWTASHSAWTFFGLASLLRDAVINIWTTVESAVFPVTVVVCTELNWEIHDIYTVLICWNSKLNITIILNNRGRRTCRNRKTRQKAHAGNTGGNANNTSTDYIQQKTGSKNWNSATLQIVTGRTVKSRLEQRLKILTKPQMST